MLQNLQKWNDNCNSKLNIPNHTNHYFVPNLPKICSNNSDPLSINFNLETTIINLSLLNFIVTFMAEFSMNLVASKLLISQPQCHCGLNYSKHIISKGNDIASRNVDIEHIRSEGDDHPIKE